jgi:hypothetical protein
MSVINRSLIKTIKKVGLIWTKEASAAVVKKC